MPDFISVEDLPALFRDMPFDERLAIVESARYSLGRYDDLRNLDPEEIAFMQAQFPDLMRAIDGLRSARRLLDFEIEVTRKPY
jgi:hypothetical protein